MMMNDDVEVPILIAPLELERVIEFEIDAQPNAQARHRIRFNTGIRNWFVWDPSARKKQEIKRLILTSMNSMLGEEVGTVFQRGTGIKVKLEFQMKRPLDHFRGRQREARRLRALVPQYVRSTPDIDNLSKFILDVMTSIVYVDDGVVVSLRARKVYDNTGLCLGRTKVRVERVRVG